MELFTADNQSLEKILKRYNVSEKSFNKDVEILQNWMESQHHLPEKMDSTIIQNLLIMSKLSIEKTKRKIDDYYSIRTQLADVYDKINPKLANIRDTMKIGYMVMHHKLHKDLYRVCFMKFRNLDLTPNLDFCNILRIAINMQELRLRYDLYCCSIIVIDCTGINASMVLKITPTFIIQTLAVFEKVYSSQLHKVYLLNFSPFCSKILTLVKQFLKPKIVQRIHICTDQNDLIDELGVDFLPKDFGGNSTSLETLQSMIEEQYEKHQSLFDQLDTLKVDESLRPEKNENSELLGFYGNFKKLDID